ncbi:MAG: hypothetical protein MJK08_03395 [Campylobacterales bacterium]|nr:hypothetical protein [Campylobacterales bacterium]
MKYIFFLLIFTSFLYSSNYNILINPKNFFKNERTSKLVLNVIEDTFNRNNKDQQISFQKYKDDKLLLQDLFFKKASIAVLSPIIYFKNAIEISKHNINTWSVDFNKSKLEQYYIIKNKNSKITLDNISLYSVNFRDGVLDARIWFKSLIYKKYKKAYSKVITRENISAKRHKLAYLPFFSIETASIISKSDFDTICEINPQLKKKLVIIKKSKKIFLTLIGLTYADIQDKNHLALSQRFTRMNLNDPREFNSLANNTRVYSLKDNDLSKLREFYKKYEELKKYEKIK